MAIMFVVSSLQNPVERAFACDAFIHLNFSKQKAKM